MKRIKISLDSRIYLIVMCILLASCTKKFDEINTDRNTIATVGASELPFLFAKGEQSATPSIWTYQVAQNLFADQYAQYFASTATYFPSDRNVIRMDWVHAAFNPIYTDMVPQLQSIFAAADPILRNMLWQKLYGCSGFIKLPTIGDLFHIPRLAFRVIQCPMMPKRLSMMTFSKNSILRLLL